MRMMVLGWRVHLEGRKLLVLHVNDVSRRAGQLRLAFRRKRNGKPLFLEVLYKKTPPYGGFMSPLLREKCVLGTGGLLE